MYEKESRKTPAFRLLLWLAIILYVTHYSFFTRIFTTILPTAFGNLQDKIGMTLDAKGINFNLGHLFLGLLWVIYTIIAGLIVIFLWLVIGELNKYYVLPFILVAIVLGIDSFRKAIIQDVTTARFYIHLGISLAGSILCTKIVPFISEKGKLIIDTITELVISAVEKGISALFKKLSNKFKHLLKL
ncbi:MAG: hypothetical protein WCE90_12330 [Candidatus Zixiibacteriota bacterium]